ncbi:MAPEG family protein [Xylariomycetidae sp. FL0641]|nr:MAPEG family protein [Xylariomycetidae sp. FL0641]
MSYSLPVPKEYGYVLTVAASSLFVNVYHFVISARARRAAGLAYPIPYATQEQQARDPNAYKFNLAQRAHGNFVENYAPFLAGLLIAGLQRPMGATYLGAAWVFGRVLYAAGYTGAGPNGRIPGFAISAVSDLALKVMAVMAGWNLVQSM